MQSIGHKINTKARDTALREVIDKGGNFTFSNAWCGLEYELRSQAVIGRTIKQEIIINVNNERKN